MTLSPLLPLLRDQPALPEIAGRRNAVLAVGEAARAFVIAGLVHRWEQHKILVAVPTLAEAERVEADLAAFLGPEKVELFPAWETLPFERVSPAVETMGKRLETLWRITQANPERPLVVVAPAKALIQRLSPGSQLRSPVAVKKGSHCSPQELVERLVAEGYRREYQVEHRGEVALRGSIVDVFPAASHAPVRVDFWGDEVDRITTFDPSDQRSRNELAGVEIFGCRELLPNQGVREAASGLVGTQPWGSEQWERLAEGLVFDGMESWLPWVAGEELLVGDLFGDDGQVVLVEPRRFRDRVSDLVAEEASLASSLAATWGVGDGDKLEQLHLGYDRMLAKASCPVLSMVSVAEAPSTPTISANGWGGTLSDPATLARRLGSLGSQGYRVVLCADGSGSAQRMAASLESEGVLIARTEADKITTKAGVSVVIQPLERGFVLPDSKLALLAEGDVTGRRRAHRRASPRVRAAEGFFDSLSAGDYVVHYVHGVGRFEGMVKRSIGGSERDYLLISYRGDDKLYVPSDQIDAITPYTGGETPSLHRMGGSDFARAKAKVRSAVGKVAEELVRLYRERHSTAGHAYAPDTPWQAELEDAFPFVETTDQLKAITEVKADMEQDHPMDRLICGDVGFGKTEVAVRAVFKAVQDGLQAAVLVPTTLLAQQHFQTFSERFAGYPVRVEVLSRFLSPSQARLVAAGVADGSVDVVIGTHRLLSGDISFKRLGLLVVDEEQRFGVTHKEAIKALSTGVDVLTLTATPIPRTLEMSLTGIRDLTLLETPPAERMPILTYVGEYDERAVIEAIRRELLREGQVFFVHNRIADIEQVAAHLAQLVPEARVAVAHGQMDEGSLEEIVLRFWQGDFDVLVCTTIIESGIDMPTVNTLVVDRADALGLGQLHQLRGRVGRGGSRAYAYLFYPPERRLSEEAYERLRTIGEHTELGSGFKIAMRDLEIRGAGNLLGPDQSGHIAAVGYDLYVRMVNEAIAETKGEVASPPAEVRLDLPLEAFLPLEYVQREDLRLEAYRRLAKVRSQEEVDDIAEEWRDRFGSPPKQAQRLLEVARLRAQCVAGGIAELAVTRSALGKLNARISPLVLPASIQVRLNRLYTGATYKADTAQLVVSVPDGADVASWCRELLEALQPPAIRPPGASVG